MLLLLSKVHASDFSFIVHCSAVQFAAWIRAPSDICSCHVFLLLRHCPSRQIYDPAAARSGASSSNSPSLRCKFWVDQGVLKDQSIRAFPFLESNCKKDQILCTEFLDLLSRVTTDKTISCAWASISLPIKATDQFEHAFHAWHLELQAFFLGNKITNWFFSPHLLLLFLLLC